MIDTEYLTQILLKSANNEDPVVFFRRVQRTIWESLFLFFPEIDASGQDVYQAFPFEEYSQQRHFSLGIGPQDYLEGRNLETRNICCHALTLSRMGPSAYVEGAFDNTVQTELCIETAKSKDARFPGVRLSYATKVSYQPFAGFYPLADKAYETPDLISRLLEMPNCHGEFFPRIDQVRGATPEFTYPIEKQIRVVDTKAGADEFMARLIDLSRPVPFLVFMGDGRRMREEAQYLLPRVYTKSYVYIIKEPGLLKGIEEIVTGIDLVLNFKKKHCRVFFPFGAQYLSADFANPAYPVRWRIAKRRKARELILNGLLRYFDLNEPGWRRTQRDVHMTQLDLQAERQMSKKEGEVADSRLALEKCRE